jgi:Flp pilus assembly protein TadG
VDKGELRPKFTNLACIAAPSCKRKARDVKDKERVMELRCETHEQACKPTSGGRCRSAKQSNHVAVFARDEDGSLIIFGLILTLLMAMMGGIAVDLMRYEERRSMLQSTIDRSVLAAASLSQQRDAQGVVEDYFLKAGFGDNKPNVVVTSGLNFRDVKATASVGISTFFMHTIGINDLDAPAASRAEQRVSNVEVSMVLDVSGSMGGSRINNLRPAAQEFIDTVLASSDPGKVTISVVPYNAQVNVGPELMAQLNVSARHASSYCVELPDSAFSSVSLSLTQSFVHNAHFDPYSSSGDSTAGYIHCAPSIHNRVIAISDDATKLKTTIQNMQVGGNTSIDLGVKWGALLLDDNAQGLVQGMSNAGAVDARYIGRPLDASVNEVLKVLVVMTDGENTTEYKIDDPYNTGLSNIYRRNSNGDLTAYHNRSNTSSDYYRLDDREWSSSPDGGNSGSTQLTWQEVWAAYPVQYVAWNLFARPLNGSFSGWYYTFIDYVSSTKDARLQTICTAAKNAGIVVYGIGFEAPSSGRNELRACSTSTSHYFDASGLEISTAFRAIASNISQLRLTQ